MARRQWNKKAVIRKIQTLFLSGVSINSNHIQTDFMFLYGAAREYFGTYQKAVEAAGYDYSVIRVRKPLRSWNKEKIVNAIMERHEKGLPINSVAISEADDGLYRAARRHFGKNGWKKALQKAGFNSRDLNPLILWTKKRCIQEIQELYHAGVSLSVTSMQHSGHRFVFGAGRKLFGSWRKAVRAAGISYGKERRIKMNWWTKGRVLQRIRQLEKKGKSLSSKKIHLSHGDLFAAAIEHFDTWGQAVEAAGFSYRAHCKVWSSKAWIKKLTPSDLENIKGTVNYFVTRNAERSVTK